MPPKQPSDKAKKVAEEKTFGMKNKNKSSKVQKFVQQLQHQAEQKTKQQLVRVDFDGVMM